MHEHSRTTTLDHTPQVHTLVLPVTGRKVRMRPGDHLEIHMRQILGSGAVWSVAHASEEVSYERSDAYRGSQSRFTTRVFRFRADGAGIGLVRLAIGPRGGTDALGHVDVHVEVG